MADEKDARIKTLEGENEALKKKVTTLETQALKDKKELAAAGTVVSDLKEKLAEKDAGTVKLPTVQVGKDTYELVTDFMFGGQEVTLEVLKEDAKLAEQLVKEGVGNLRKVTKA